MELFVIFKPSMKVMCLKYDGTVTIMHHYHVEYHKVGYCLATAMLWSLRPIHVPKVRLRGGWSAKKVPHHP